MLTDRIADDDDANSSLEGNPEAMDLSSHAEGLAGRALWQVIGDRDERIGTDPVIRFARRVTAASLKERRPALVDLHVLAEPNGHTTPTGSAEQAAEWIARQMFLPR